MNHYWVSYSFVMNGTLSLGACDIFVDGLMTLKSIQSTQDQILTTLKNTGYSVTGKVIVLAVTQLDKKT